MQDSDSSDGDDSDDELIQDLLYAGEGGIYGPIAEILILLAVVGLFLVIVWL